MCKFERILDGSRFWIIIMDGFCFFIPPERFWQTRLVVDGGRCCFPLNLSCPTVHKRRCRTLQLYLFLSNKFHRPSLM